MNKEEILKGAARKVVDRIGVSVLERTVRARSIMYVHPPLILPEREDGLHHVRRPAIALDPSEAVVTFESVVDLIFSAPENLDAELGHLVGGTAAKMIRRFHTPEGQVVALLWYLGGARDVTLDYGPEHCLIRCEAGERGIHGTELVSQFTKASVSQCSPADILLRAGHLCKGVERTFILSYAAARNLDRSGTLAETVALIYQSTTPAAFRKIMLPPTKMTLNQCKALENVIHHGRDPLHKLYRILVPRWMTHTEFLRNIRDPTHRDLHPDSQSRSTLYNKLAEQPFFRTK